MENFYIILWICKTVSLSHASIIVYLRLSFPLSWVSSIYFFVFRMSFLHFPSYLLKSRHASSSWRSLCWPFCIRIFFNCYGRFGTPLALLIIRNNFFIYLILWGHISLLLWKIIIGRTYKRHVVFFLHCHVIS